MKAWTEGASFGDEPWMTSTWTRLQASVHVRMVVKMVLTEVKMMIQTKSRLVREHLLTGWSRMSETRVDIMEKV